MSGESPQLRLIRWILAASVVGGPAAFLLGGLLAPPSMHTDGVSTLNANALANPATNTAHVVVFVVAGFLLPIGVVGLAWLAYPRTPWLATIGGLLGVVGWIPFSALVALDDLAVHLARLPAGGSYAVVYERFGYGPVMNTYLIIYIAGHLLAYVLLGIALWRARAVPAWAGWAMVASSPLTVAMFVLPGNPIAVGAVAVGLLVAGSIPATWAILTRAPSDGRFRRCRVAAFDGRLDIAEGPRVLADSLRGRFES